MTKHNRYQYKDFQLALKAISGDKFAQPRLIIHYGPSEYLCLKSNLFIRNYLINNGFDHFSHYESKELTHDDMELISSQGSLFQGKVLHIVKRAESTDPIIKYLLSSKSLHNTIILNVSAKTLTKKLEELTKVHSCFLVPCIEPFPNQLPSFIIGLARKYQLEVDPLAAATLSNHFGKSLFRIDNELQKLGLVFHGTHKKVTQEVLHSFLNNAHEEDAFQLTNCLLRRKFAQSSRLLEKFILDGKQPLSLLGIISYHIRQCIMAMKTHPNNPQGIANALKVSTSIACLYENHIRTQSLESLERSLQKCQEADLMLKSTRVHPLIILQDVIGELLPQN